MDTTPTLDQVKLMPAPASLNKPLVRDWVDALRSGEYTQTRAYLERVRPESSVDGTNLRPVGHCCLGVLCAITPNIDRVVNLNLGHAEYDGNPGNLPDSVMLALGFDTTNEDEHSPEIRVTVQNDTRHNPSSLATLNDAHKWTFGQIADLIERDWL